LGKFNLVSGIPISGTTIFSFSLSRELYIAVSLNRKLVTIRL
jgi:hypothetical protein